MIPIWGGFSRQHRVSIRFADMFSLNRISLVKSKLIRISIMDLKICTTQMILMGLKKL